MNLRCDSLDTILGVVPVPMSAWKPETAPHMMVMQTKGQTGPLTMGPPPQTNAVVIGIWMRGMRSTTPRPTTDMVPIFMYDDR